jgi:hypothetical protein
MNPKRWIGRLIHEKVLIDCLLFCYIGPGVVRAGPAAGGQGAEAGAEGAGPASAHTQAQQSLRQVSH